MISPRKSLMAALLKSGNTIAFNLIMNYNCVQKCHETLFGNKTIINLNHYIACSKVQRVEIHDASLFVFFNKIHRKRV